ncbi:MAG: hypothetical protein KIT87_20085 [Anaerolineae bacterium]|nr:hypothetical protein [Anaerolineae bacterium]
MNHLSRPTALKIAAVISFLVAVFGVITSLPFLARGAQALDSAGDAPPYVVIMMGVLLSVVAMIAAYGAWKQQRWGIILTIIANTLNGLLAAPGIFFAPSSALFVSALVGVILSSIIVVLCLWREPRPATT